MAEEETELPPAEEGGGAEEAPAEDAPAEAAAEEPPADSGEGAPPAEAEAPAEGDPVSEEPPPAEGGEGGGEGEAEPPPGDEVAPDEGRASPPPGEGEGPPAEDAEMAPEASEAPPPEAGEEEEPLEGRASPDLDGSAGRASPTLDEGMAEGGVDSAMLREDVESPMSPDSPGLEDEEFGEDEEEYEEDKVDPLQVLQDHLETLQELNERATQTNVQLQRRVIQRKNQDKSYDATEKQSEGKVTEHKYQNVLLNVHSIRLKLRLQQVKAARMSEELKNQLEAKRQKAIECRDSFQEFKRQVARHAEYARTGKKIPEKIIQEVEEFELDKDAEVEEVRGSNISLKNRLVKLEQALRKKDELAENLHVIDFEQLKIENQTLNEKIEERNEELHKLRKKTIVTVQVITHMREKVQFVQQEYQSLRADLAQLELELTSSRDLVAKTKHERDDFRTENAKLRQQTGIMNSEHLSKDFEDRKLHIEKLTEEITAIKTRHKQLMAFIKRHGGKV